MLRGPVAISNNQCERRSHIFLSISSIQHRDWTLELAGFGCAAFEAHDVYLIYEVKDYDTEIILRIEIFLDVPA